MTTPASAPLTPDERNPDEIQAAQRALLTDLGALALIVAGVFGLLFVAFDVDWRLGVALLSACAVAGGIRLATREG